MTEVSVETCFTDSKVLLLSFNSNLFILITFLLDQVVLKKFLANTGLFSTLCSPNLTLDATCYFQRVVL